MQKSINVKKISRMPHPLLRKKDANGVPLLLRGKKNISTKVLWTVIGDTLLAGNAEEIDALRCPICGGSLAYEFMQKLGYIEIKCDCCDAASRYFLGNAIPNFVNNKVSEDMQSSSDIPDTAVSIVAFKATV